MNPPADGVSDAPLARTSPTECWLAAHRAWLLVGLVIASIAIRAIFYVELSRGPCLWQHQWQQTDMAFFDTWARAIAHGDWLTRNVHFPPHQWHETVAEQYQRAFPEAAGALQREAAQAGQSPADLLWTRWYGRQNFYKEPLYPYLVGITYRLAGGDARYVFLWQMLVGVLSNVLVYLIARRCFGELAGLFTAALAVFCSPVLYYELLLLRETMVIFAGLLLIHLTLILRERPGRSWWLLFGLVSGLSLLLKSTFLLYVAAALPLLVARQTWRRRIGNIGLALAGIAVALSPAIARNVAEGAPPLSLSSIGAVTFVCSNAADVPQDGFAISQHTGEIMGRTGGRFAPAALMTLRTHSGVSSVLMMLLRKWDLTWYWYEIPNNSNFYYFGLHAPILRYLPITCAILAPLALVGIVIAWARRRTAWPLLIMVGVNVSVLLMFAVMSRLRVPLLSLMVPLAGLTLARICQWIGEAKVARVGLAVFAAVVLAFWTDRPLPEGYPKIRVADYQAPYEFYYDPQSAAAALRGDYAAAGEILSRSLRVAPPVLNAVAARQIAANDYEIQLAVQYADVYSRLANYLDRAGDLEAAVRMKDRARVLQAAARPLPIP